MRSQRQFVGLGLILCLAFGVSGVSAESLLQQSLHIHYDETVRGQLTESSYSQIWTFTGHAGDLVLVEMRAIDSGVLDPYLNLDDSGGITLLSDDDGGDGVNARIGPYPLPTDGEYSIEAMSYSGTGEYTLELKHLNTIPTIVPGKPLTGTLSAAHPSDYFLLAADPTQSETLVRLHIEYDDPYADPFLSVYGPSGFMIGTETQTDTSTIEPVILLPGQTYAIAVTWNPNSASGTYQLLVEQSNMQLLQSGLAQTGTLMPDTYSQRHYFRADEGEIIRIIVSAEGEIAPAVQIATLDFSTYLFTSEGENTQEVTAVIAVAVPGVYVVDVHDGSYAGGSGTYTIRLERVKS